ncbi:hypothetical protein C1646_702478, partial [Rhizophagus diaphanus]
MSYFSFLFPITSHLLFFTPFHLLLLSITPLLFHLFISIFLLGHCNLLISFIYCYCLNMV